MEAFLGLDWVDLVVFENILMCCFRKANELQNPMVGLKVMASGSELMHLTQFSRYLDGFDSDFDP